jgi:hypothetical protein
MKKSFFIPGLILVVFVLTSFGQTKPTLNQLAWLSGCWEGRQGESLLEEHWSKPEGESMLGFGRTIKNNKTVFYMFLQIRQGSEGLNYIEQVDGKQPVQFRLTNQDPERLTFENPANDFPKKVTYQRQGLMLLTTIEGIQKEKQVREEFLFKRVRCNDPAN